MVDNRESDMSNTDIINDWMDSYVYSSTTIENMVRYSDLPHQFAGVDITFTISGIGYTCDEKTSVYRMNQPAPTFAMSISQVNKDGVRRYDWFMNDTLDTDSYMFEWLDVVYATPSTLTKESIKQVTFALVRKDKITEYLNSIGWTHDRIIKMNDYMQEQNMSSWGCIYKHGCKWIYDTGKYRERSINLLIPKTVLLGISDWTETVRV